MTSDLIILPTPFNQTDQTLHCTIVTPFREAVTCDDNCIGEPAPPDKTLHNKKLAKAITYYLRFIDELYHVIENRLDLENAEDKEQFEKIKAKYKKVSERGAQVKGLLYVQR